MEQTDFLFKVSDVNPNNQQKSLITKLIRYQKENLTVAHAKRMLKICAVVFASPYIALFGLNFLLSAGIIVLHMTSSEVGGMVLVFLLWFFVSAIYALITFIKYNDRLFFLDEKKNRNYRWIRQVLYEDEIDDWLIYIRNYPGSRPSDNIMPIVLKRDTLKISGAMEKQRMD